MNTIVPVVVAQVGCTVTLAAGVLGAVTVTVLVAVISAHPPEPVTV